MPGPMYGNPWPDYRANTFHSGCQKGERCQGPGCRVYTGKTAAKRRKHGRILRNRRKAK